MVFQRLFDAPMALSSGELLPVDGGQCSLPLGTLEVMSLPGGTELGSGESTQRILARRHRDKLKAGELGAEEEA